MTPGVPAPPFTGGTRAAAGVTTPAASGSRQGGRCRGPGGESAHDDCSAEVVTLPAARRASPHCARWAVTAQSPWPWPRRSGSARCTPSRAAGSCTAGVRTPPAVLRQHRLVGGQPRRRGTDQGHLSADRHVDRLTVLGGRDDGLARRRRRRYAARPPDCSASSSTRIRTPVIRTARCPPPRRLPRFRSSRLSSKFCYVLVPSPRSTPNSHPPGTTAPDRTVQDWTQPRPPRFPRYTRRSRRNHRPTPVKAPMSATIRLRDLRRTLIVDLPVISITNVSPPVAQPTLAGRRIRPERVHRTTPDAHSRACECVHLHRRS